MCPTGTAPEERWASSSTRLAEAYTAGLEENKVLLAALRLWARRCSMRSTRSRPGGPRAPSDACRVRTAHNFWPAQLAETADAYYDPAEESNSAFSAEADPDAEQAGNWVTESAEEAYYAEEQLAALLSTAAEDSAGETGNGKKAEEQLAALLSTAAEDNAGETGNGKKENLTAAYVYVAEATATAASLSVSGSDGKSDTGLTSKPAVDASRKANIRCSASGRLGHRRGDVECPKNGHGKAKGLLSLIMTAVLMVLGGAGQLPPLNPRAGSITDFDYVTSLWADKQPSHAAIGTGCTDACAGSCWLRAAAAETYRFGPMPRNEPCAEQSSDSEAR